MTVPAQGSIITSLGNGTAAPIAYARRLLAASHLMVTHIAASGARTVLTIGVHYTVTGGGSAWTVTPAGAIAIGDKWELKRETPREQTANYVDGDAFSADTHETALDRQMLAVQELGDESSDTRARALMVPAGEAAAVLASADDRANTVLGFDLSGQPVYHGQFGGVLVPTDDSLSFLPVGTAPIARTMRAKMRDEVSVSDFRSVLDVDWLNALNRWKAWAITQGGGELWIPGGLYQWDGTFELNSGSYDIPLTLRCTSHTILEGTGGADVVKVGGSMFLRDGGIVGNPTIRNTATGGHLLVFGAVGEAGCTECRFDVSLDQRNPAKSAIRMVGGEVYDSDIGGRRWTVQTGHSAIPVEMVAQGTTINGNRFRPKRCYNARATQFFDIRNASTTTWLVNNIFENINFEKCRGGAIKYSNCRGLELRNLAFWDVAEPGYTGGYTGHIIWAADRGGYQNNHCVHINCIRHGDVLAAGKRDIFIENGFFIKVVNCFNEFASAPSYDWNNNVVAVEGLLYGELNAANRVVIGSGTIISPAIYADEQFSLGGTINPERYRLSYAGGYVIHEVRVAGVGQIWGSKNGGGAESRLVFAYDSFWPLTTGLVSLGFTGQAFTSVALTDGVYVNGLKVAGARGAAIANPTDAASTQAALIALLNFLRGVGTIAT